MALVVSCAVMNKLLYDAVAVYVMTAMIKWWEGGLNKASAKPGTAPKIAIGYCCVVTAECLPAITTGRCIGGKNFSEYAIKRRCSWDIFTFFTGALSISMIFYLWYHARWYRKTVLDNVQVTSRSSASIVVSCILCEWDTIIYSHKFFLLPIMPRIHNLFLMADAMWRLFTV